MYEEYMYLKFFLKALRILLRSRSSASPCTVVIHLRPLRCCTRTWTLVWSRRSSWESANGSDRKKKKEQKITKQNAKQHEATDYIN